MYTPSHFLETNTERVAALIDQYGFATLISRSTDGLQVTHAPMQFNRKPGERDALIGHIARANPHARLLVDGADVLVIFQGPHAYVSPTWYLDEDPNDSNVPTWNYVIVHVYGHICRIDDAAKKWNIVTDLAAKYEQGNARPWLPGDLSEHADKLSAIVGFEVVIDRIDAKTKLSQNRSVADQENLIEEFESRTDPNRQAIARLMRENIARQATHR